MPGKKFYQKPIAGGGGKIWSTITQYINLIETVNNNTQKDEVRIFVSHVSPGKEPFIKLVGIHTKANLLVSGHMGPPFTMAWNEFTFHTPEQSLDSINNCMEEIEHYFKTSEYGNDDILQTQIQKLTNYPNEEITIGRGQKVPWWYRNTFYLNLPDAEIGHAVLKIEDGKLCLETFGKGLKI
ncbi:hypothetical protein ACFL02_06350 [Planctomycetota bacterium]